MFFEGAEKKFEIHFDSSVNLLLEEDKIWEEIVQESNATILSQISNSNLKAFLLSESSLFVWKNSLLMITCGTTTLVNAALACVHKFDKEKIDSFIFQRKNEYLPHLQKSNFIEDINKINEVMQGQSHRFGKVQGNHNLLFHLDKEYSPKDDDKTFEILLYDISKNASSYFMEGISKEKAYEYFDFKDIFDNFNIDHFSFDPFGYSLNAIYDNYYFTIHVTPQQDSPYVSFESNITDTNILEKIFLKLLERFNPGCYDIISFNQNTNFTFNKKYFLTSHYEKMLGCGYNVVFLNFHKQEKNKDTAYKIS